MWFVKEKTKQERLSICAECEYKTKAGTCGTLGVGDPVKVNGEHLRTCGCILTLKTSLVASHCPLGKWSSERISKQSACELKAFISEIRHLPQITGDQVRRLYGFKSEVAGRKEQPTNCPPCVKKDIEDLWKQVRNLEC